VSNNYWLDFWRLGQRHDGKLVKVFLSNIHLWIIWWLFVVWLNFNQELALQLGFSLVMVENYWDPCDVVRLNPFKLWLLLHRLQFLDVLFDSIPFLWWRSLLRICFLSDFLDWIDCVVRDEFVSIVRLLEFLQLLDHFLADWKYQVFFKLRVLLVSLGLPQDCRIWDAVSGFPRSWWLILSCHICLVINFRLGPKLLLYMFG